MKMHSSTPAKLEIRHRPVFWAVVFGCILFVLAGWGLAGLLEGEWMAALIAVGISAVMGWLLFRQLLISFSLVLDRDADRITYQDTKGVRIDTPLSRLTSVACDAKLDTDHGEAQRALVLHLDDAGEPTQWSKSKGLRSRFLCCLLHGWQLQFVLSLFSMRRWPCFTVRWCGRHC